MPNRISSPSVNRAIAIGFNRSFKQNGIRWYTQNVYSNGGSDAFHQREMCTKSGTERILEDDSVQYSITGFEGGTFNWNVLAKETLEDHEFV